MDAMLTFVTTERDGVTILGFCFVSATIKQDSVSVWSVLIEHNHLNDFSFKTVFAKNYTEAIELAKQHCEVLTTKTQHKIWQSVQDQK
tara:strand:+ start:97 stop:360 length:264 start_codon:yes stop_codon:yes gene_type:complete